MTAPYRLGLLGMPRVTTGDQPVRGFKSRKVLALLCYLAVRAQTVSRTHLASLFWGEMPEAQGRANLSRALNNLTTLLPDSLRATRDTITLATGILTLDVNEFEARARHGTPESLQAAAEMYHDEFMAGMYLDDCPEFEVWLVGERERRQQRIVSVLECLAGYHARRGDASTALAYAARLLEIEPWREEAHRDMMRLLVQTGQRSAALQQYETVRRVLAEELGVDAGAETTALYQQILRGEVAPSAPSPHNLPAPLTTFLGRETELTRIAARLNNPECRLLTFIGAGGIGKTRLAVEAARNLLPSFRDGVFFVALAPLGAGQIDLIVPAIATALGLALSGPLEPKQQILNELRDKNMLLVLDNFEHLLDGVGLVIEIFQHAPAIKILAVSREPLDAQAEWLTRVQGLSYPTTAPNNLEELSHYSAVQLFVDRAERVSESFALNSETAPHIVRLTQIVEGMPLALELAAARTRSMRLDEIRAQVESNLDILVTTMRDVEARHSSLRAVLNWSHALLSTSEQELFRRLSVFAGGWTPEAAAHVVGGTQAAGSGFEPLKIRELLARLELKSLVLASEEDGATRYRMLEPIREYAREKLTEARESESTAARHLEFYMRLAMQTEPEIAGAGGRERLKRLELENDNLRAAMSWDLPGRDYAEQRLRLASALRPLWHMRGNFAEGRKFLEQALLEQNDKAPISARANGYVGLGTMVWVLGEYEQSIRWHSRAVELYREIGDTRGIAEALYNMGGAYLYLGDYERAEVTLEESLALAREVQDSVLHEKA